jgi:hypothetical protein
MKYLVSKIRGDIGDRCSYGQLKRFSQLLKVFSFEDMCQHIRDTSHQGRIMIKTKCQRPFEESSIHMK